MKATRWVGVVLAAAVCLGAKGAPRAADFPYRLDRALTQQAHGNVIFSPYSVSRAFLLADLGARGKTQSEIENEIDLQTRIAPPSSGDNAPALSIANRIWLAQGIHLEPAYAASTEKETGAAPGQADFAGNPGAAEHEINSWVATQTHDKIQNLIPPGSLNGRTRVILTNAVYFKGPWETPFKKQLTRDGDFFTSPNHKVSASFMHEHERYDFAQDGLAQVIELPYLGREFVMLIALPATGVSMGKLEASLSAAQLARWDSELRFQDVMLSLPKFKFDSDFVLNTALRSLGVRAAFEPGAADFSGIDGGRDLYISNVFHKAFVAVDEAGTEAAAATAIEMRMRAVLHAGRPFIMNVNRPFLFMILDQRSKAPLFIGRVTNPKG